MGQNNNCDLWCHYSNHDNGCRWAVMTVTSFTCYWCKRMVLHCWVLLGAAFASSVRER